MGVRSFPHFHTLKMAAMAKSRGGWEAQRPHGEPGGDGSEDEKHPSIGRLSYHSYTSLQDLPSGYLT